MCIVIAAIGVVAEHPVVLGANRDEYPAREGSSPALVSQSPRIWAGLEPKGGGTWLGVNEYGVIVALTNRHTDDLDAGRRTRGLLCLDLLRGKSADAARDCAGKLTAKERYNNFNLFCADRNGAWVGYYIGRLETRPVNPGLRVLTHGELDAPVTPKIARARKLIEAAAPAMADEWIARLKWVCSDEDPACAPADRICIRTGEVRTLSSSILALHETGIARSRYLHCAGLPGQTLYADFSHLFTQPRRVPAPKAERL
jgi:uncharacterized protein with NRDE domain